MDNRRLKQIIIAFSMVIFISSIVIIKQEYVTGDEKKFKREFEHFNNKISLSFGKEYPNVYIEKHNHISYVTSKEAIELIENGTGILLLAYRECIGARLLIEDFLEICSKMEVEKISYLDAYSMRDEKEIRENSVATLRDGSSDYQKIIELLGNHASVYEGIEDGSKRIYFPTILFIKDGKIIDSYRSSSEIEESFQGLSAKAKKEFKKQIEENIKKLN